MMEITLERTELLPSDELAGTAAWQLDEVPTWIEVRLIWFTRGKGTQDAEVVEARRIEHPAGEGREAFRFTLPDSPYSFSGKLISLVWAVEVVTAGDGGATRAEFVMSPTGREVRLGETSEAGGGWAPDPLKIPR